MLRWLIFYIQKRGKKMADKETAFVVKLMKKHSPAMAQLTYRRTGSRETTEDLIQEVYLLAYCKRSTLYTHDNPAGWLFMTLKQLTDRELDKRRYAMEQPLPDYDLPGDADVDLPMKSYLPNGLTEDEQEVILLRVRHKLSFAEIGEVLGIKEMAARQRYNRAIKKCRDLLSKPPEE